VTAARVAASNHEEKNTKCIQKYFSELRFAKPYPDPRQSAASGVAYEPIFNMCTNNLNLNLGHFRGNEVKEPN
jgi:hypothetical protein